ncbi:MAG TPA: WD40 repeat domain-containing protein, partial [Planctomycetaceae bacterium]|nr:WD40 repeat domain-containing protein [Planctomycetaceae bacterium]
RPRFSPDGNLLAAASSDGDLRLWDCAGNVLQRTWKLAGEPLAFSPDGRTLISYRNSRVFTWDVESGTELRMIDKVPALNAISPDGLTLAAGNPNIPDLRFWNLQTGELRSPVVCPSPIASLAFAPDSSRLVTGGADHALRQWNPGTGSEEEWSVPAWGPVAASPEGQRLAIVRQGKVEVRDLLAPDQTPRPFEGDATDLEVLAWSPTDRWLAGFGGAGFFKAALRMWDTSGGQEVSVTSGHGGTLRGLAFGPSGQRLATVGDDRSVQIWDVTKRTVLQTLDDAPKRPFSLAFDRERRWLASAGDADAVVVWDLQTRRPRTLDAETRKGIRQLAFGPDGSRLVAAATAGLLLWDLSTGKVLRTLACKPGAPLCLSLNATGNRLAAAGNSGTVWIWTWPPGQLPAEEPDVALSIGPPGGLIRQVFWSLDGRHLLTVNGNSTLYALRLPVETPGSE